MKLKKLDLFILAALFLFAIGGLFGARYLHAYQKVLEARASLTQELLADQQGAIERSGTQIAALLAANQSVAEELAAEAARRLEAEQESRLAQSKLEQIIEQNKAPNASAIISEWRPRVALVRCEWPLSSNRTAVKSASAVLLSGAEAQPITSKHVLEYQGEGPELCTLDFPDQKDQITIKGGAASFILPQNKYDWAKIRISQPPAYALALAGKPAARCAAAPAVGDSVIILGYPNIGARGDITATEGIISGIEADYYITSAKVERGNSGGAAILAKANCYLGIPTFVDAGEIESLARILKHQVVGP